MSKKKPPEKTVKKKVAKKVIKLRKGVKNTLPKKQQRFKKLTGPGKVYDTTNWRRIYQDTEHIKFDDTNKYLFLTEISQTGQFNNACKSCDISPGQVRKHLKDDPEFHAAYMNCRGLYADRVRGVAQKLALEGVEEPIVGGRNRDEVVAYKKVYATNILAMEMKRTDSAYKDRQAVDLNVQSGVLLVPAGKSMEEWEKENQ